MTSVTSSSNRILVTGGAGYIGSHTTLELLNEGFHVTVIDNLSNSSEESLRRVGELTGKADSLEFANVDICDVAGLEAFFSSHEAFFACIHFAGLKAVGESVQKPILYYQNNVTGTLNLLEAMEKYNCRRIVFSSSATVYANPVVPITESSPIGDGITNPYGRSKYMIEEILRDHHKSAASKGDKQWGVINLRYFNPIGAHISGRIGEDPRGIPNNLMPYIAQVAVGRREHLTVFGTDYDTVDGTGVRDYIHVVDLALGHVAAVRKLQANNNMCDVYNLGTGNGVSVLQMLEAMGRVVGREIPRVFGERRGGDIGECYANTEKAAQDLGWTAQKTLDDMCTDTWRWQSGNPMGYSTETASTTSNY